MDQGHWASWVSTPKKTVTQLCITKIKSISYQETQMATRAPNRRGQVPRRDSRIEELDERKRFLTDYFAQIRRGLADDYDYDRREDIISTIIHPKHGRWRGMQDPHVINSRPPRVVRARAIFAEAMPQTPGRFAGRNNPELRNAYRTTFRLNQNFTPAHITFRKILGYGGFGVAALFGLHDSTGREVTVVVKADLRPDTGPMIRREKTHMILMAGAQHVVQRTLLTAFPWPKDLADPWEFPMAVGRGMVKIVIVIITVFFIVVIFVIQIILWLVSVQIDWIWGPEEELDDAAPDPADNNQNGQPDADQPAPAQPAAAQQGRDRPDPQPEPWSIRNLWPNWPAAPRRALGIDGRIRQNRQELDNRQDIISMEYLKFGDLSKWMGKVSHQNISDPDAIFSEEVAWTVFECLWRGCVALAYPTGFYQGKDPLTTQIPPIAESTERSAVGGGNPLVHFDLDPSNIFVGDFDPDHGIWPVTKIGDLGLSILTRSQVYADDIDEESRRWGLRRRGKSDFFLPEQMTEEWDYIPNLNALRNHEVADNYAAHSNIYHIGLTMFELLTLNLPDEPPFARAYDFRIDRESLRGWTYGHNLLEENNPGLARQYSAELRHTVAWCMEHNPNDRPSLVRLGQIVERNAGAELSDESEEHSRLSVDNLLGNPLPPAPR